MDRHATPTVFSAKQNNTKDATLSRRMQFQSLFVGVFHGGCGASSCRSDGTMSDGIVDTWAQVWTKNNIAVSG